MENNLQSIEFDGEFELIQKACGGMLFTYPVLHISDMCRTISFNKAAKSLFPENVTKMFMITFKDYVGILPDNHRTAGNNLFSYDRNRGIITCPAALRAKKVLPGYYKLYRCKDGIAFNRYERLDRYGEQIAA